MDTFKSLLSPLSGSVASSGMLDGAKLIILGGTVETARRVSSSAWSSFVNSFFLTAHFSEEDYPYDWLLYWLQKQPQWARSREFETTTCTVTANGNSNRRVQGDEFEDELQQDEETDDGRARLKVVFQPTYDTTHTIYYKGHWLRVRRSKKTDGSELQMLSISVVARSNTVLKQLVLEAKREYEKDTIHRVQIYFADSHGGWRYADSRHKRPLSSIVLGPGVKEMLLADSKDFLRSESWYADRGIPYRRGYLLYGTPGSGKSSLIHALAGELALDIYVISLSASWMNDSTLTNLMSRIPARSILLLEDLDAAFTHSTSRDSDSTGAPEGKKEGLKNKDEDEKKDVKKDVNDQNTLSLSGLLNSLDSIQASEGRILFATTNHLERLDPALSRPGRMDVWVEFKNASKYQAEGLFRNFFPAHEDDIEITTESTPVDSDGSPSLSRTESMISSVSSSATTSTNVSTPSSKSALISHEAASTLEHASPLDAERLTPARLTQLAKLFAESIPEEEFSVAALQGYLLKNKTRAEAAALDAGKWVIAERELRERLAREKEERERKTREERDRRRKEREERERKEKEEKERKEKEEKEKEKEKEKAEAEAKEKAEKEVEKKDTEKAKSEPAKDEAATAEQPIEPVVEKAESIAPSEDYEKVD